MSEYWREVYAAGRTQLYPWDSVVSFVFRHAPRDRPRADVRILEVGCGTASNLWFAAREGFAVAGVEIDETAVRFARERFAADGLSGDLRVGSFTTLPFEDGGFDLVIDRGGLTCGTLDEVRRAVGEVGRVSKPGAAFHFNPYADSHTSAREAPTDDNVTVRKPPHGDIAGIDQITFVSRADVLNLLAADFEVRELKRVEVTDVLTAAGGIHAEWRAIAVRRLAPVSVG